MIVWYTGWDRRTAADIGSCGKARRILRSGRADKYRNEASTCKYYMCTYLHNLPLLQRSRTKTQHSRIHSPEEVSMCHPPLRCSESLVQSVTITSESSHGDQEMPSHKHPSIARIAQLKSSPSTRPPVQPGLNPIPWPDRLLAVGLWALGGSSTNRSRGRDKPRALDVKYFLNARTYRLKSCALHTYTMYVRGHKQKQGFRALLLLGPRLARSLVDERGTTTTCHDPYHRTQAPNRTSPRACIAFLLS